LVVDVRANIGLHSIPAIRTFAKNSLVVCIELDPRNFNRLKQNFESNLPKCSFRVLPIALAKSKGHRSFTMSEFRGTSQLSASTEGFSYTVEVDTLENVLLIFYSEMFKEVIIRVDIEGFEPKVLLPAMSSIAKLSPKVMLQISRN
jgi:FkbM family methyltransferase